MLMQAKKLREVWKHQFKAENGENQKIEADKRDAANKLATHEAIIRGSSPISIVGNVKLPDLRDPNRNFAIKKLAEEIGSEETLARVRENDPDLKILEPEELSRFMVKLELGKQSINQKCTEIIQMTTASSPGREYFC